MPGTSKLHGPASQWALNFAGRCYAICWRQLTQIREESSQLLGTLIMWFAGRDQHMQVHHRESCSMSRKAKSSFSAWLLLPDPVTHVRRAEGVRTAEDKPRGSQSLGLSAWWLHRYFHPRICEAPVRQGSREAVACVSRVIRRRRRKDLDMQVSSSSYDMHVPSSSYDLDMHVCACMSGRTSFRLTLHNAVHAFCTGSIHVQRTPMHPHALQRGRGGGCTTERRGGESALRM